MEGYKEKRRDLRRTIRKAFKKDNLLKMVIVFATLALVATSILPYLLLR